MTDENSKTKYYKQTESNDILKGKDITAEFTLLQEDCFNI